MTLLADFIGFANPSGEDPIEIIRIRYAEMVNVISRRHRIDAGKACVGYAPGENEMAPNAGSQNCHRHEQHPGAKGRFESSPAEP
jgi:hypothetical protein